MHLSKLGCLLCTCARSSLPTWAPPTPPPPPRRYDTRKDVKFEKDAPVIGLVLQRSHLVTGDHGHYDGVVAELEARGAKASLEGQGGRAPLPASLVSALVSFWLRCKHLLRLAPHHTRRLLVDPACPSTPRLPARQPSMLKYPFTRPPRRWCPCLRAAWTSPPP